MLYRVNVMLALKYSKQFKKDLRAYKHDRFLLSELEKVLDILSREEPLPKKYHNHHLLGEFSGCFDCHLSPSVVLIYKIDESEIMILLLRIGSHAKLF